MIRYFCPDCRGKLENSASAAGMTIICRHCKAEVKVPTEADSPQTLTVEMMEARAVGAERVKPRKPITDRIGKQLGNHTLDEMPKPMGMGKRMFSMLLGFPLTGLGALAFIVSASAFVECASSHSWPTTDGRVESAKLDKKVERTGGRNKRIEYSAKIAYQYQVQNQQYTGSQIAFGTHDSYSFLARRLVEKYPPNQKVKVYYEPDHPDNAVLEREVFFSAYVYLFVGTFVGWAGLRVLVVAFVPTIRSSNSRWWPWSRRFTWPDLFLSPVGAIAVLLWFPMLFGL